MSKLLIVSRVDLFYKGESEIRYIYPVGRSDNADQAFNLVMLAQQYGSSRVLLNGTEYTIVGAARAIRDYFPKEGNHV